jgi:hypothetical protein
MHEDAAVEGRMVEASAVVQKMAVVEVREMGLWDS